MSTTAISSSSIFQELQSFYQNRQSDLKQLGNALQSGDLSGAQQAFSALSALGQSGPFSNSEPFSKSSRAQAFDTLGQALQSGDLAGAQAAFAALTAKQSSSQSTPAAVVNLSGAQNIEPLTSESIYQQLHDYRQQRKADLAQLGQDLQSGNLTAAQQDVSALTALGQSGPNKNGQVFQRADRAQDFQAIGQALQSGDLAGAQAAYANLAATFGKQDHQAQAAASAYNAGATEIIIHFVPPPSSTGTSAPPVSTTPPKEPPVFQSPPAAPPVVTSPPAAPPVAGTPPTEPPLTQPPSTNAGSSTAGLPEIVINVGGASSSSTSKGSASPELVINLGQGGSASSPEEIQINFGSSSSGGSVSIDATQGKNGSSEQININLNQQNNLELIVNLANYSSASPAQTSSGNGLSVSA